MTPPTGEYRFTGFAFPTTTPVPDQLFDELLPILSGAELKVLLYIIRRTFGFKKESDDISLSQMLNGIIKADGTVLDQGVGLSKPTLLKALQSLKEKNIVLSERRMSEARGNEPSRYRLNILSPMYAVPAINQREPEKEAKKESSTPLVKEFDQGVVKKLNQGLVKKSTPQQTDIQQTVKQQHARRESNNNSGGRPPQEGGTTQDVVVASLTAQGIAKTVATRLASRYSAQRIAEKIEYLEFLQATSPNKLTSPKGWLRRAIEEDYAAPDGYQDAEKRQAKQRQLAQEQDRLAQLQREDQQKQEAARQERQRQRSTALKAAEQTYHTTQDQKELWEHVRQGLLLNLSDSFKPFVQDAHLLSVDLQGTAVLGAFDRVAQEMLEKRLAKRIRTDLSQAGMETKRLSVVLLSEQPQDERAQAR